MSDDDRLETVLTTLLYLRADLESLDPAAARALSVTIDMVGETLTARRVRSGSWD
ncbi:hypothetical protein LGH83_09835 [Lichenihabitans sp. PAMC28606]|uniref:hypothetical protein n=1 Tax=Lichenihabitans sp. PAMC28606 TaxID=2880932 RepID=UPI001D0A0CDB|nr:hypothetical protein [Lichenihabitans sp. PAMC28606]UDL96448.1 hypothetical protein LGH83_09835 [Lichenihabitans sp. PAMC28606]